VFVVQHFQVRERGPSRIETHPKISLLGTIVCLKIHVPRVHGPNTFTKRGYFELVRNSVLCCISGNLSYLILEEPKFPIIPEKAQVFLVWCNAKIGGI
jgi:hypothetical protein